MPAHHKIPQELWIKITSHLPSTSAVNAAEVFKFEPKAYDRVWNAVFKTERWLHSAGAQHANIVLIGVDLDILSNLKKTSARAHLMLTAFDRDGDLQYEDDHLHSSFRGVYNGLGEAQLEQLALTIGRFDVPEVLGKDFRYLFSGNGQQLQTKYCYWKDPRKRITTIKTQDIRGIGGPITKFKDLDPIFLLNLQPPAQLHEYRAGGTHEQFIFRRFGGSSFWTGCPPLVNVIREDQMRTGEYTFKGFTFNDKRFEEYDRQKTDWVEVAETETGYKCDYIQSS
jgi:hypothetical protein